MILEDDVPFFFQLGNLLGSMSIFRVYVVDVRSSQKRQSRMQKGGHASRVCHVVHWQKQQIKKTSTIMTAVLRFIVPEICRYISIILRNLQMLDKIKKLVSSWSRGNTSSIGTSRTWCFRISTGRVCGPPRHHSVNQTTVTIPQEKRTICIERYSHLLMSNIHTSTFTCAVRFPFLKDKCN